MAKHLSAFPLEVTKMIRFIYLFGVLRRFQHCTGHITTGSWKGRGNQYIQFVRVLYCKLPTNGKQLPAFPLEAVLGIEPRPQRWEARVLPLCHRGPSKMIQALHYPLFIFVNVFICQARRTEPQLQEDKPIPITFELWWYLSGLEFASAEIKHGKSGITLD